LQENNMKLDELLEIVHQAYPDELTRVCWDSQKRCVRMGMGDTLAEFIVREILDTFEPDAPDAKQIGAALDAMRWAAIELGAVISALERHKDAHAKKG
jgi:hypothetical protein